MAKMPPVDRLKVWTGQWHKFSVALMHILLLLGDMAALNFVWQ
jgi:hypothetical protein